jgi:hypothetical protein
MNLTTKGQTAEFLSEIIRYSGRTQAEIARDAGFSHPNVLSMMKLGHMKVPLDRIPDIAGACGILERDFLRVAMEEYHPEIWGVLRETFDDMLTEPENELLAIFRLFNSEEQIVFDHELVTVLASVFTLAAAKGAAQNCER